MDKNLFKNVVVVVVVVDYFHHVFMINTVTTVLQTYNTKQAEQAVLCQASLLIRF